MYRKVAFVNGVLLMLPAGKVGTLDDCRAAAHVQWGDRYTIGPDEQVLVTCLNIEEVQAGAAPTEA